MVFVRYVAMSISIDPYYSGNKLAFAPQIQLCPGRMLVLCCLAQCEGRNPLGGMVSAPPCKARRPDVP